MTQGAGSNQARQAERVALRAHGAQRDRAGRPCGEHLRRVADSVREDAGGGGTPDQREAAGWLHDTVEDTSLTAESLLESGFLPDVVEAVRTVIRRGTPADGGETYADYIGRIVRGGNTMAIAPKRADLLDHLTVSPEGLTPSLRRRYETALARLDLRLKNRRRT
ncbi:MAG: hypothetical protein OXN89_01955 [Bryobacterales bacterium]|nr:hypothetical protein [Bryobacterales bacterium]